MAGPAWQGCRHPSSVALALGDSYPQERQEERDFRSPQAEGSSESCAHGGPAEGAGGLGCEARGAKEGDGPHTADRAAVPINGAGAFISQIQGVWTPATQQWSKAEYLPPSPARVGLSPLQRTLPTSPPPTACPPPSPCSAGPPLICTVPSASPSMETEDVLCVCGMNERTNEH